MIDGGKRERPGELPHVQNLGVSSSYSGKAKELRLYYLVQLEVRKLETHPLLLVPRWTGFNIKSALVLWLWRAELDSSAIPFLFDMRHLSVRMPEMYTAFNKVFRSDGGL